MRSLNDSSNPPQKTKITMEKRKQTFEGVLQTWTWGICPASHVSLKRGVNTRGVNEMVLRAKQLGRLLKSKCFTRKLMVTSSPKMETPTEMKQPYIPYMPYIPATFKGVPMRHPKTMVNWHPFFPEPWHPLRYYHLIIIVSHPEASSIQFHRSRKITKSPWRFRSFLNHIRVVHHGWNVDATFGGKTPKSIGFHFISSIKKHVELGSKKTACQSGMPWLNGHLFLLWSRASTSGVSS